MKTLYNLGISLLHVFFYGGSLFNKKLRLGYRGRKNWQQQLKTFKAQNTGKIIWIHCASLGEFEMAKPLIDELNKNKLPDTHVLISFFSPSGYEVCKNSNKADGILYMPLDTPKNARAFVGILKPHMAIFVKYEFWLNHIHELKEHGTILILINGIFRKKQIFFRSWGGIFREGLSRFDVFFLQNKGSENLLKRMLNNFFPNQKFTYGITGDLRYDRVMDHSKAIKNFPQLETFKKNACIIVGGSTWDEEEWILKQSMDALGGSIKLIIAPHDVSENRLKKIEKLFSKNHLIRFTQMKAGDNPQIVLVDTVGHLSSLYSIGHMALVGGGFSGRLHNIIEPAVYGIPVFFGYKFENFPEAQHFLHHKMGIKIHNGFNFTEHVKTLMADAKKLESFKHKTISVFKPHLGGTQQVYYKVKNYITF